MFPRQVADPNHHLIEVPLTCRRWLARAQVGRIELAKLTRPAADRILGVSHSDTPGKRDDIAAVKTYQ
jgi:hypothetical protein